MPDQKPTLDYATPTAREPRRILAAIVTVLLWMVGGWLVLTTGLLVMTLILSRFFFTRY